MPTYEYQCGVCGHQMEAFQKITDEPLTECPKCQKPSLNKLISATNFQLKGTGWYVTDIRDKGKPKENKDEEGAVSNENKEKPSQESAKNSSEKSSPETGKVESTNKKDGNSSNTKEAKSS